MKNFDIRGAGTGAKAGSMSGGNMQKVVIAREFSFDAPRPAHRAADTRR